MDYFRYLNKKKNIGYIEVIENFAPSGVPLFDPVTYAFDVVNLKGLAPFDAHLLSQLSYCMW